ncbi:glutathione-regulated potassium-efflux system oxidoreductase KefF [Chitinophaga rhizosphaerae]|uniref:glutathione-regulated potassium-efflux system oxidoreductase KefF n=1 Tax=Chitinophaga rhizosphaerae TaxID=1864947 RepID=UPI000F80A6AA|nr:NAD(P)H-dependent oxidoreductase [Chitinophaga rhizosphaerae]
MKILILFAHPAFERSRVHARLIKAVRTLPGITLRDLYEEYPDFDVQPKLEQPLLEQFDLVILQHPFYWYSGPALLKQWMDLVLEHGWAYGKDGTALKGKYLMQVISTGGNAHAYSPEGHHGHAVYDFLLPFRQTAALCHMEYLPPYVVPGSAHINDAELGRYADGYVQLLQSLSAGTADLKALMRGAETNAPGGMPGQLPAHFS